MRRERLETSHIFVFVFFFHYQSKILKVLLLVLLHAVFLVGFHLCKRFFVKKQLVEIFRQDFVKFFGLLDLVVFVFDVNS